MSAVELVCAVCPASCTMRVVVRGGVVEVTGNRCPRGVEYARQEIEAPTRYVISVVRVVGGDLPTVSVKTRRPVPKDCIWLVMEKLKDVVLTAPVNIGDVVLRDVCGTDVVATRRVARAAT